MCAGTGKSRPGATRPSPALWKGKNGEAYASWQLEVRAFQPHLQVQEPESPNRKIKVKENEMEVIDGQLQGKRKRGPYGY
jgi:hypothetical protein